MTAKLINYQLKMLKIYNSGIFWSSFLPMRLLEQKLIFPVTIDTLCSIHLLSSVKVNSKGVIEY